MTTKTIAIEGMSCGHCVQWISQALMKVEGVQNARVSIENQNAIVDYDETRATPDKMKSAIEMAGYTVKSFS
ncbi:MAG: heavy-metal-associated domain-containing protein [Nitrospinae bacterium]|nr:heavy-metal-associated domain-containing protein [Nitrospinota bacterium]